ncbi:MAG TPA: hypothetical protein VII27_05955 [Thermoplasmata archaeon]
MSSERTRAFLGVWMPMILGVVVIAFAANFFFVTSGSPGDVWPAGYSWDAWRSACTGGLVFVGLVLCLSTFGRYRKAKAARSETQAPPPPPPTPPQP